MKRNLLALVTPVNFDSLKVLTEDGRPNVVTVLDSNSSVEADAFLKKMRVAAQANRDFLFSSVVASEWPKFVRPFALGKKPLLPTVIIWDKQFYAKVSHSLKHGRHLLRLSTVVCSMVEKSLIRCFF